MRNRALGMLIAMVLCVLPVISATALTMAGFDGESSNHNWSENEFFTRMEARTGLTFTFDEYTSRDQWQTAKNTMFSTGELPDVLFKAALSIDEQIAYSDAGKLIDLLPLLQENAPHLWSLFEAHPDWLAAITLPSGKVAALPSINPLSMQNAMWINQTWLDALNLDAPTDWASLVEVLQAFQTKDPNKNGKQDEIPLSFLGPWDLKFLSHAFGIVVNDYNIYVDESGQVRFLSEHENFTGFIKALVSLKEQELLDPDGFTNADALRAVSDDSKTVTYGMFFGPNPYSLFTVKLGEQFTLLEPLAYHGTQVYRDLFGPVTTGSFAITSACEDPAAVLRWVDVLYTQDGAIEAMAGLEGENYEWNEDGTWKYSVDLQTNSSFVLYDLSVYDTGSMPWLFPIDFYAAYDTESLRKATESLLALQQYVVSPFPYYYVLTKEQYETLDSLQFALGTYVDESIAKFVLGELDIDSDEDLSAFSSGLTQRGLQEFLSFWQEIYNQQRIR
ncbi:MAG TPA: extracellular solute-binding protein [Candidatus Limiplasma sp.]|nr:extracellular solute-binding protein [Candidatus Limiplasma sp.]